MSKKLLKVSEEDKGKAEQLRKAYRLFMKSPNGKIIMADLEKRFYHIDMSKYEEYLAGVKVGRHSVVLYIRTLGEEK